MARASASPLPPLAQAPDSPPTLRACLFALGEACFAVDVRSAREVAGFDDFTVVPRSPQALVGVANLRGTVLPIVDIRARLGLPVQRPGRSVRTLVLRDGPFQAAVVVDAVLGLEPFDEVVWRAAAEGEASGPGGSASGSEPGRADHERFTAGRVTWGGAAVILLDAPKILKALRDEMRETMPAQGGSE